MTDYYIRVTTEEPSIDEADLWFKMDSANDEVVVLGKDFKSDMDTAIENLQSYLEGNSDIQNVVSNIVESGDFILQNTENAVNLVKSGGIDSYDYNDLKSKFDDIDDELIALSNNIDSKAPSSALVTISSTQNNISTNVSSISNGLNWSKADVSIQGTPYENVITYNDYLVNFRMNIGTGWLGKGNGSWKYIMTIDMGGFEPIANEIVSCNNGTDMMLTPEGYMYMRYTKDKIPGSVSRCNFLYLNKNNLPS